VKPLCAKGAGACSSATFLKENSGLVQTSVNKVKQTRTSDRSVVEQEDQKTSEMNQ